LIASRNSLFSRARWFALRCLVISAFGFVYPLAARIGGKNARRIVGVMGLLFYYLDVDWRSISLRQHFVRERTSAAMREILPDASARELAALVRRRFVWAAQEELDAHCFFLDSALERECSFVGLDAVLSAAGRTPLVILTLHMDSPLMATAQLGKSGLKLNLMTSNVVEDIRVPAVIRRFFQRKYDGIKRHFNGGEYWHSETGMRDFYRALGRGEAAVVLCEAPAPSLENGYLAEFLGKVRVHKRGALRLVQKSGAALVGMIGLRTGTESYKVLFSPVFEPSMTDPETAVRQVYAFLGDAVRSSPDRWWAADLLPAFINLEERH
jgi:lauroyl/myristoyl acyltransferase